MIPASPSASVALDRLSDPAVFETVASAVLRRARRDIAGMIHTGINASGKPIASPVDGIAVLASARFILIQHTTSATSELRRKWLGPEGDLPKALRVITDERARAPEASLTLILSTNRVPDERLVRDVHAQAKVAGIEVDIWDRTRLADFIEHEPDGQWLGRKYLGLAQARLSEELLSEISTESTAAFFQSLLDDPQAWIARELDSKLSSAFGRTGITFLVMPSGSGKSTAVARQLRAHVESGGYGLWVRADAIANAHSLQSAVTATLQQAVPTLESDCGSVALSLPTAARPLLLVLEDVNRSARPGPLLERIASWWPTSDQSHSPNQPSVHVVCSLWPSIVRQAPEPVRGLVEANAVVGGSFSRAESIAAIQSRRRVAGNDATVLEADQIATALGDDPLLIALAGAAPPKMTRSVETIIDFINGECERCAAGSGQFIAADLLQCLDKLSLTMLTRRQLQPTWTEVCQWLNDAAGSLPAMRLLVNQRTVCQTFRIGAVERFAFRHDRVLNAALAAALNRSMAAGMISESVIGDPFFAEVVGLALQLHRTSSEWIGRIAASNPLALFHAAKGFVHPYSEMELTIVDAIKEWLNTPSARHRSTETLRWRMQTTLCEMEGSIALQLAALFNESSWPLDYARFKNGDARSGAVYCYSIGPETRSQERDALIQHVRHRFGADISSRVGTLLRSPENRPSLRIGALHLAGFLGVPSLMDSIDYAWEHSSEREQMLPAFIWATTRCANEGTTASVRRAIEFWHSQRRAQPEADAIHEHLEDSGLRWAFAKGIPSAAVQVMIEASKADDDTRLQAAYLLDHVDEPNAAAFVARSMAEVAERCEQTGGFSFWLHVRRERRDAPRYTAAARLSLRAIWSSAGQDRHLRIYAFKLWALDAAREDIPAALTSTPLE